MKKGKIITIILRLLAVLTAVLVVAFANKECPHKWGEWNVSYDATCVKEGLKTRKCNLCGEYQEEKIDLKEHSYDLISTTESTCEMPKINEYECLTCGHSYRDSVGKSNGHTLIYSGAGLDYECLTCCASSVEGRAVFNDLTAWHGNGENYVAGGYDASVGVDCYLSLVLNDGKVLGLNGVDIYGLNGVNALAFSKSQAEERAMELGYFSGEYDIRLTIIFKDGDVNKYVVNFNEQSFDFKVTSSSFVTVFIGVDEEARVTVVPAVGGVWSFTSNANYYVHAELCDSSGNLLAYNYGDHNFNLSCDLIEGNTYYLTVKWQYEDSGSMEIIVSAPLN